MSLGEPSKLDNVLRQGLALLPEVFRESKVATILDEMLNEPMLKLALAFDHDMCSSFLI